ncbi:MAG TPA: ABC transporter ATP-binding protein [Hyphomicrobiales bacterium]|nr:ABC transporter ATP-binding protein [Hyphomicrobiales bacterium]
MDALLEAYDLHIGYGGVEAVRGVSLAVRPGEITTVIGANGAGKTTLLNGIMGVLPAYGRLSYLGRPLAHLPVEARVAVGLILVPERRELFWTMSVEDNLRLGAFRFHGLRGRTSPSFLERVLEVFPRLKERRRQLAGTLSGGERQMLAMGRALMAEPRLLMLDEPSLGLAPLIVSEIFRVIAELKERGVAILLVEQNARAALRIADYGYVMENGTCVLDGPSDALRSEPRIVETYLGLGRNPAGLP